MSMEGDTQNEDGDFRGLTFSRIEKEGLGELPSAAGLGWRTFLVFDPKNQRLARLNAVDLDRETKRREAEVKFGAKRSHRAFETIFDDGQDDDSLYYVSSLRLESEPLTSYLEREAPLKPAHGFQLIVDYLDALRGSGGFELAPEGLGFFVAERLRISTEADGAVRLVFCGFGAAEDQDSKLPLQERIAALAARMGLGFSVEDLPKKGGLGEFLNWMESFRDDLPKEDSPVSKPESEIRKWLGENNERRDAICKAAPKGMAELVPHLKVADEIAPKEKVARLSDMRAEAVLEAELANKANKAKEDAEAEKARIAKISEEEKAAAKAVELDKSREKSEPGSVGKPDDEQTPIVEEVNLLQRFQDRMRGENTGSEDDVEDLLPGYQASRQRRSSPMALALFFCTVAAILIWVVSLNLDVVADSVSKMLGRDSQPRSGFQEYQQDVSENSDAETGDKAEPTE